MADGTTRPSVASCFGVASGPFWRPERCSLELVSSQFGKQRLALWIAGRGPDPFFPAMVFWPELCQTKASCKRTRASCQLAVQEGKQIECLKLVFIISSESNVWHYGLPAAGLIRPSLPWCFGPARGSFDRSCAGRKPAARGREQVGSWQCRRARKRLNNPARGQPGPVLAVSLP